MRAPDWWAGSFHSYSDRISVRWKKQEQQKLLCKKGKNGSSPWTTKGRSQVCMFLGWPFQSRNNNKVTQTAWLQSCEEQGNPKFCSPWPGHGPTAPPVFWTGPTCHWGTGSLVQLPVWEKYQWKHYSLPRIRDFSVLSVVNDSFFQNSKNSHRSLQYRWWMHILASNLQKAPSIQFSSCAASSTHTWTGHTFLGQWAEQSGWCTSCSLLNPAIWCHLPWAWVWGHQRYVSFKEELSWQRIQQGGLVWSWARPVHHYAHSPHFLLASLWGGVEERMPSVQKCAIILSGWLQHFWLQHFMYTYRADNQILCLFTK